MRVVLSAAIMLLAACASTQSGDPASDVSLSVEPTPATAGDSVVLTLNNQSAEDIGYNLCPSALERQAGGSWQAVPSDRVCTMELRTLRAGQQTTHATALPDGLVSGDYRYTTTIEVLSTRARHAVRTGAFRVAS